jgi:EmrB/QacA subfamily drug resistance transporter
MEPRQSPEPVAYDRKWYVMAAVGVSIFLATLDLSIVNVALPTLVRALRTDFPTVQWVILAYSLALATLLLSVGRLGDMLGKKPIFTAGFGVFVLGSFLCGLAPGVYWLIAFRVLQAVGATMLLALGAAILTEAFPPSERGRALGVSGAIVSIGIVVGPTIGGLLIDALSWRWIFMVNVPVGLVGTLVAARYVPATRPTGGQRFDYLGAITFCLSLLGLLLALTIGQQVGFTQPAILLLFAAWLVFLAVFLAIEARTAQPMIDLSLFRNQRLRLNLITGALTFFAIAGALILMPFYLENILGYETRVVGLLLAAVPIGLGVTSPFSGALADRLGTRSIAVAGLLVLLSGYLATSTLSVETTAAGYLLRLLPIGIGMGIFQSPNNSDIMGAAPQGRLGVVSGLLSLTRTLGQTVGIAVLGALWASRVAVYAGGPLPAGAISAPAAAQVSALQDTVLVSAALVAVALGLAIWALVEARKTPRPSPQPAPVIAAGTLGEIS